MKSLYTPEHHIWVVFAHYWPVGRHTTHRQLVDAIKLRHLSEGCTCHTSQLGEVPVHDMILRVIFHGQYNQAWTPGVYGIESTMLGGGMPGMPTVAVFVEAQGM